MIGFPRDVRGVGTAIAGIATAGLQAGFAAELERGEAREEADLPGGDLIDRDADVDIFAVGFLGVAAGEIDGHGAGVIAGAVAVVARPILGQARKNEHVVFERRRVQPRSEAVRRARLRLWESNRPCECRWAHRGRPCGEARRRAAPLDNRGWHCQRWHQRLDVLSAKADSGRMQSNSGKAIAAPKPRSTVRREMRAFMVNDLLR